MPTVAPYQLAQGQRVGVDVELMSENGAIDTTSVLALSFNATVLQASVDPGNNRRVIVKALGVGTTSSLTINRQGTVVADPLTIPFQLVAAPNLSKVTLLQIVALPPE